MRNRAIAEDRPHTRTLPYPGAELYAVSPEAAPGAVWPRLAAKSLEGKLSLRDRISRSADPARQVWHLLYLHRRAFETEMKGYRSQADCHWRDLDHYLGRVWENGAAWDAAAEQLLGTGLDGNELRRVCIDELVLDCHIAFAYGLIRVGPMHYAPQLPLHMASIEHILNVKQAGDNEFLDVMYPLVALEVEGLQAAGMHSAALACLRSVKPQALRRRFTASIAELVFSTLLTDLEQSPGAVADQIDRIGRAIDEIDALRGAGDEPLVLYELLGLLHKLQCVQMVSASRLADAMLACEKARTYWPPLEGIKEIAGTLHANMLELKKSIAELEKEMQHDPSRGFSVQGLLLKADAERGFEPVQSFIGSPSRREILSARESALDRAERGGDEDPAAPAIDARLHIPPRPQQAVKGWSGLAWTVAAQDRLSQAMLAASVVFNVVVGAIVVIDLSQRGQRDEAVAALRAPGASDEQRMAAAARFLSAQTPGFRDPRTAEVKDRYAQAFTRWFNDLADPAAPAAGPRIAEYRKLDSEG